MLEPDEVKDILISWITLSIAFAWNINPYQFISDLPAYLLAVGTAFVFHELAHKFTAMRFGYPARFIAWWEGLLLAVGLAFITNGRFVFAAPGAVYVFGNPSIKENGIISVSGPVANLLVASILYFIANSLLLAPSIYQLLIYIAKVNAFIGFFNMLPIFPLDGSKVLPWNPIIYTLVTLLLAYLAFFV